MSTILMSIKPEYVLKIFDGSKKYEYRKIKCKDDIDKIIVYSSFPIKKVVGELIIDKTLFDKKENIWKITKKYSGITKEKYDNYFKINEYAVAYKIKNCIKYDNQKELIDYDILKAPQSFTYISEKNIK